MTLFQDLELAVHRRAAALADSPRPSPMRLRVMEAALAALPVERVEDWHRLAHGPLPSTAMAVRILAEVVDPLATLAREAGGVTWGGRCWRYVDPGGYPAPGAWPVASGSVVE